MFDGLKRRWEQFADAEPGERFMQRYQARRRRQSSRWSSVFLAAGGILLIIVGGAFMVIPGPGIPIAAVGAALIAAEFRWAAKSLDTLELFLRQAVRWIKRTWRLAPVPLRVVVVVFAGFVASAAGYGAYRVVFG